MRLLELIKVGVDDSCFLCLVGPVEELEDVPADQLIASIDNYDNGVLTTVID